MFTFGVILLILILAILAYLYMGNSGGEKTTLSLWKTVFALFVAFGLLVGDILKEKKSNKSSTQVLLFPTADRISIKTITDSLNYIVSEHRDGYNILDRLAQNSGQETISKDYAKKSMDIVEYAFWEWLASEYPVHWQVDKCMADNINYFRSGQISPKENCERKSSYFTKNEIINKFSDNIYSKSFSIMKLALPKGANWTVDHTPATRTHTISTDQINLTIKFYLLQGGSTVSSSSLAEKLLRYFPEPVWWSDEPWQTTTVKVEFQYTSKLPSTLSLESSEQVAWAEAIMSSFNNQFSWSIIRKDLDRALTEKINLEFEDMLNMQIKKTFGHNYDEIFDKELYDAAVNEINKNSKKLKIKANLVGHTKGEYGISFSVEDTNTPMIDALLRIALDFGTSGIRRANKTSEDLELVFSNKNSIAYIHKKSQKEVRRRHEEMQQRDQELLEQLNLTPKTSN